jgi:heat shock protein HslJ
MTFRHVRVPVVLVAALCAAACAPDAPRDAAAPAAAPATAAPAAAAPAPASATDTGATLVAFRWRLDTAVDAAGRSIAALFPAPDRPLGVEFVDGRLGVTGGCNRLSAPYRLVDGATLELGAAPSTMMACPPPLAAADAAFAGFLRGPLQVAVDGEASAPRLRLAQADGTALTFTGTPTPETRFGGPGTRAFLEVSPAPCVAPAPASPPCLTVRDRHFDEQGLQSQPPGEWRALPEGIEGYAPTAGQQQVVRVKRFEAAPAGGAPQVRYVLDMVVETRTVP